MRILRLAGIVLIASLVCGVSGVRAGTTSLTEKGAAFLCPNNDAALCTLSAEGKWIQLWGIAGGAPISAYSQSSGGSVLVRASGHQASGVIYVLDSSGRVSASRVLESPAELREVATAIPAGGVLLCGSGDTMQAALCDVFVPTNDRESPYVEFPRGCSRPKFQTRDLAFCIQTTLQGEMLYRVGRGTIAKTLLPLKGIYDYFPVSSDTFVFSTFQGVFVFPWNGDGRSLKPLCEGECNWADKVDNTVFFNDCKRKGPEPWNTDDCTLRRVSNDHESEVVWTSGRGAVVRLVRLVTGEYVAETAGWSRREIVRLKPASPWRATVLWSGELVP